MLNNKKVLFTIPKIKSMYGDSNSKPLYPHVGIAYLTSVLKKNGYEVKIYDEGIESSDKCLFDLIDTFKPNIIGVTGFSYAYGYFQDLIKRINEHTKTPIVAGGPHVSAVGKEILKSTKLTFALTGEGEVSLLLFLEELFKKKPHFENVPGLIWRSNKSLIENHRANYIQNLDQLPFPNYFAFKYKEYPCFKDNIVPIITSRGCPYSCNYCSVRLSMGQCFRPRSPENVFKEIKYWYKLGFNQFDINDDCFTLDIKRAEKICDLIIKNKLKIKIQLYNGIRVDRVTFNLLKKLKKSGCIFIAYGCESGSQNIIAKIGKNIKLDQVRQAVNWTNKAGIKNAVNFIIGHQEETYEDAQKTLTFAKSLPTNFVNFYNLVPYPGTPVYEWVVKNAKFLVPSKTYLQNISYRENIPIFETSQFTQKQRRNIMKIGFNLYEQKLFEFRFGKFLGYAFFLLTRINCISRLSRYLVTKNPLLMTIFKNLTKKSRE